MVIHGHARRVMPARGHASTAPCLGHHETVSHARHPLPSASEPDAVEFVNIGSHDLAKRLRRLFRDGKPNKLNPAQFAKMTCWNSGRATRTGRGRASGQASAHDRAMTVFSLVTQRQSWRA